MFSMSLPALRELLRGSKVSVGVQSLDPRALSTGWHELDRVLPDGGFPEGFIELSMPSGLGGGSTVALIAMRAAMQVHDKAYCAWVECADTPLFAPAVRKLGLDPERLLVVRTPPGPGTVAAQAALKTVQSGAFELVVLSRVSLDVRAVRKLVLAAEETRTRVLALTHRHQAHSAWPVTMRLELERHRDVLSIRVARERRGRTGTQMRSVPLRTLAA
jgi:hypothetical protein